MILLVTGKIGVLSNRSLVSRLQVFLHYSAWRNEIKREAKHDKKVQMAARSGLLIPEGYFDFFWWGGGGCSAGIHEPFPRLRQKKLYFATPSQTKELNCIPH